MDTTLRVSNFSLSGGDERLRVELSFKGARKLEPRQYRGTNITFTAEDKSQVTLAGEILCVPWTDEVQVHIWPSREDLYARLSALLKMLLPGIDSRTMINIKLEET
jgi:hypothetical protein